MSDRAIDRIDPAVIASVEQYHAMANDVLNQLVAACREDFETRPKNQGMQPDSDDSLFTVACSMFTMSQLDRDQLQMLTATAVYRLARQQSGQGR